MSKPIAWKRILTEATLRVQKAASEVARRGERSVDVGLGASGDRTLLADKVAEDELLISLSRVGRIRVLSEEAGETGDPDSKLTAILDPLDGSSNFMRGIPFYCSSTAVVVGRELNDARFALVRNLVNGDVYFAEKGRGATKNGKPISTSKVRDVRDSVTGADLSSTTVQTIRALEPLLARARRQVHFGANALELCLLAEGKIDLFVDTRDRMRIVDFAAAYLVVREAGGMVSSPSGESLRPSLDLKSRFSLVASANRFLHEETIEVCNEPPGKN